MIEAPLALVPAGHNDTRIWGMTVDERLRRIAGAGGFGFETEAAAGDGSALVVSRRFVFDPLWVTAMAERPGEALTLDGATVIAHVRDRHERDLVAAGASPATAGLRAAAFEDGETLVNRKLRKRERPFVLPLRPDTVRQAERISYFGAYKGVTDLLTKYLWPEWALVLTRLAARGGISPNMVTAAGALFCVVATILFWEGHYWAGMAAGLTFMVLDTVDGKLARCTITSSELGNVLDHGLDIVHPPFWWWAWAVGLGAYGLPYDERTFAVVLGTILGGYVVQRLIEGAFIRLYGIHIHVWRRFDSQFRLITARRNPNMVILFVSMLFHRPDLGLIAVAWWTALSLVVHAVQFGQAVAARRRGEAIGSWLAQAA